MDFTIDLKNEKATKQLGQCLSEALPQSLSGIKITLSGEMGAGKSTLVRAALRSMGYKDIVPSPTYTLVEPYEFDFGKIYHIDLYRINDHDELNFLGWDDLSDGLMFIEWPQRVPILLEQADITFTINFKEMGRKVRIKSLTLMGDDILSKILRSY
jgi:tRNA threonylcarbamoyladenosine biosynthesis protein TsaE